MASEDLLLRCDQCGEMNRLPSVYCKKCGTKLNFAKAEQKMMTAERPTLAQQTRTLVRLAVALGMLVIVLLTIWPARMVRTVGEELDAKRYRLKGELLIDALNREVPASQVIEEKEINAYLRGVVAAQPAAHGVLAAALQDAGARFFPGRAEIYLAISRGPLTFTSLFYVQVKNDQLVVTGAKLGHLPLPGILGRAYANTQINLFRQFRNEARIVRHLSGALIQSETIELLVGPVQ